MRKSCREGHDGCVVKGEENNFVSMDKLYKSLRAISNDRVNEPYYFYQGTYLIYLDILKDYLRFELRLNHECLFLTNVQSFLERRM